MQSFHYWKIYIFMTPPLRLLYFVNLSPFKANFFFTPLSKSTSRPSWLSQVISKTFPIYPCKSPLFLLGIWPYSLCLKQWFFLLDRFDGSKPSWAFHATHACSVQLVAPGGCASNYDILLQTWIDSQHSGKAQCSPVVLQILNNASLALTMSLYLMWSSLLCSA